MVDGASGDAHVAGPSAGEAADALLDASRVLVGVAATSLAELDDITLPQFRALVVLTTEGPSTVGTLAARLDVHPSTATRLCDRLVRKALVERTRPSDDRRTTTVTLAPAGRDVVAEVTERRRRALVTVAEHLAPAERAAVAAALATFTRAAEGAGAASPAAGAEQLGWAPVGPPGPGAGADGDGAAGVSEG